MLICFLYTRSYIYDSVSITQKVYSLLNDESG